MEKVLRWTLAIGAVAALLVVLIVVWERDPRKQDVVAMDRSGPGAEPSPPLQLPNAPADEERAEDGIGLPSADAEQGAAERDLDPVTVHGRLVTEFGLAPDRGKVELRERDGQGRSRTADVDREGRFGLAVEPGTWSCLVSELPPEFLPPYQQEVPPPTSVDAPAGFFGHPIEVPEGVESIDVEVRVFRASSVTGRVLGSDGQPVAGVFVGLLSVRPDLVSKRLAGPQVTGETNALGEFRADRVYPGLSRARVYIRADHPEAGTPRPYPQEFVVVEGSATDLIIELGAGPWTLGGVVVDQDGEPFPNLELLVYHHSEHVAVGLGQARFSWNDAVVESATDGRGRFSIRGLETGSYGIQVGHRSYDPHAGIGGSLLGGWPETVRVRVDGEVDALRVTAYRTRPFTLRLVATETAPILAATVSTNLAWVPPDHELSPERRREVEEARKLGIELEEDPDAVHLLPDGDGGLVWRCETPHVPVRLRMTLPTGVQEEVIHPLPGETVVRHSE